MGEQATYLPNFTWSLSQSCQSFHIQSSQYMATNNGIMEVGKWYDYSTQIYLIMIKEDTVLPRLCIM